MTRMVSEAAEPHIRQMMADTDACLNCGTVLKYYQRKEGRRNRGYCSLACYYAKPPKMAYAEREWDKPVETLLVDLLNRHTAEATADLLGVGKWTLYKWIERKSLRRVTRWEVAN